MGCKQSRQLKVQPIGDEPKLKKCASENDAGIESDIKDKSRRHNKRIRSSKNKKSLGSSASLDDDEQSLGSDRGCSAGSKKSNDSGLGDVCEYNHGFITEHSDPDKVKQVEANFQSRDDLELGVTGTAIPTRNSAKDKARLEESMILQKLRDEGLISTLSAEKKSGISFDIMDMNTGNKLPSLPPLRLAKLERRRKKKKTPLTEEEIAEKLRKAEQRRKKKEQARLDKIKEMDKSDHTAALESFQDYQKKKEDLVTQKMDTVTDNRERRLREIKEKQLERERRREEVRRRKKERSDMELATGENHEIIRDTSELFERQETPIVPE